MRPVPYYCRFVYLSLLFLLVLPLTARAEDYSVDNIHVEAIGQTATEARQRAMSEAESKGFTALITRLSNEATANRLLQEQRNISLMVQGVEIKNEKFSATSYAADVKISFSAKQIQAILAQSGVSPVANTTTGAGGKLSTLVLPVFTQDNQTVLLEGANPWWNAWNTTQVDKGKVAFVLPLGDLEDISTASLNHVRSNDYNQLKPLSDKYGTNRILVADATYGKDIETQAPILNVVIYDMKPEGTFNSSMQFKGQTGENIQGLLAKAVSELVTGINTNWQNQGQLAAGEVQKTLVKAVFSNLQEWQRIQQQLKHVSTIQKTSIERFAGRYAVVAIYSSSKLEDLPNYFQKGGFSYTVSDMPTIQLATP